MGRGVVQRHPGPTDNAEVQAETTPEVPTQETAAPSSTEAQAAPSTTEVASQPGTGTTGTTGITGKTPTGLTGDARHKAIHDALGASATGMWAQRIITTWSIPIEYEVGGRGSLYQGGEIFLNKTMGIGGAAITLMHEAQHADTYKSGKQADRTKLARAEYRILADHLPLPIAR